MSPLAFFEWCEQTAIGGAVRDSIWLFPVIEVFHLLGLAILGGAVLMVDLRLLGLVLKEQAVRALWKDARRFVIGGILLMIASGVPLFLSEATKCYYSTAFRWKMYALAAVIVFTFTIRSRVVDAERPVSPAVARLVGLTSVALWAIVGWGGRWIGFS
jgi:hypothetical protein